MASRKSEIEMALYDWIESALREQYPDVPIRYSGDGFPTPPSVPYVLILLVSRSRQGKPNTRIDVRNGVTYTQEVSRYQGRVRITVIGSSARNAPTPVSAWDVMERIENSIYDYRVRLDLSGAETMTDPSMQPFATPIDPLTDAQEVSLTTPTGTETRIVQDYSYSAAVCRESDAPVDCIERAVVTGTIDDITVNVTAP